MLNNLKYFFTKRFYNSRLVLQDEYFITNCMYLYWYKYDIRSIPTIKTFELLRIFLTGNHIFIASDKRFRKRVEKDIEKLKNYVKQN